MKAKRVGALLLSVVLTVSMGAPVYAGEAETVSMEAVQEEAQKEFPGTGAEMEEDSDTEIETGETGGAEGDETLLETSEAVQTSEQDKGEGQEDAKISEAEDDSASEVIEDTDAATNTTDAAANAVEPESVINDLESEETETLAEEGIQIPDDALNSAVHSALGLEDGDPVTEEGMLGLTELSVRYVLNLEGLQYAKNLAKLELDRAMVQDSKLENLEVITELTQLKELEISVYHINDDDLQIIAKLSQLEKLTLNTNDITDISVLADMKNLNYLDLSENAITDVSVLAGMPNLKYIDLYENNLSDVSAAWGVLAAAEEVNLGHNRELEENPDFQEAYFDIAFDSIEICQMLGTVNSYELKQKLDWELGGYNDENTALMVQISIDDESIAEAELESSYYWAVPVTVTAKALGETKVNFTLGDVTKTLTVIVGQPEAEIPQVNVTDKLPQFQGSSTDAVLYEGSIWNFNGEKTEKISGDKNITNYVSRKVYFVTDSVHYEFDELETEYAYEIVGLDENNILYYWPALGTYDSGLGLGEAVVVAEDVKDFNYDGYIDKDNVYHLWQYLHEEPVAAPVDICTQENADRIENDYLILQDGTTMTIAVDKIGTLATFPCKEYITDMGSENDNSRYYLNYDNEIIMRTYIQGSGYSSYELWVEDVTDIGGGCYLKGGNLYSVTDQKSEQPIDTEVNAIYDSGRGDDGLYFLYYQKGKDIYKLEWEYGQDRLQGNKALYSKNAVKMYGTLVLNENGEVWVDGEEGGYLYITSVKELYQTSGGGRNVKYVAVRYDGTAWSLDPPLAPYMSFEAQNSAGVEIWQGVDVATGISVTGQGIAENVRLYASTVKDDTEGYKTEYESIAQSMEELGATAFSVYDIKLLDEQENAVQPEEGNPVTVTVPLPEGYSDNVKVYHMDSEGNLEELGCTVQENTVNFQTSGFSLFVIADFETEPEIELPFTDVQADDWYYEGVSYVYQHKLMTGMTDTLFAPEDTLVRAQFATVLYRMNGEPEVSYENVFPDVPEGQWFTEAVMWASNEGIVNGYGDTGLFGSDDNITREQMALMMHRYAEYKGSDTGTSGDLSEYKDASEVSEYAKEAMQWAVGNGIIVGEENGTALNPQGNATRAECAMIIERFVEKYGM